MKELPQEMVQDIQNLGTKCGCLLIFRQNPKSLQKLGLKLSNGREKSPGSSHHKADKFISMCASQAYIPSPEKKNVCLFL